MAELPLFPALSQFTVIPVKAGILLALYALENSGTPAFAGATILEDRRG